MSKQDSRWPQSLYGVGGEPDPRFTLANERTFLAWVRSSLAMMAVGVAINELEVGSNDILRFWVVLLLILSSAIFAIGSFLRWIKIEKAMRLEQPLPAMVSGLFLVVVFVTLALLVGLLAVS